ncbi:MAG: hypothetical protein HOC05_02120 [Gemmatimonadetes bacterium]|nr:hypothetical protein [Gemmatimonadota bacterium]MBT4608807.1 hypothetical protein [Gemmatimonadota bacterium]MBT5142712.1 hypothetical protein [Gemmatimonadota bacterium]MBT5587688.1 hypothetical protein [Gemmatimonadota bacterium]MBT5960610.1 hypothetical protein [Gemmatimonadota bacterium]
MGSLHADRQILRSLAERYSAIAHLDIQAQRMDRYFDTIGLKQVRPVVLIDEVPWGEIREDALVNRCELQEHRWLERLLRCSLYQWEHFQVDRVFAPIFQIPKRIHSTGIGVLVQETQIKGDTGAYIASHGYVDQLQTDANLERLELPVISYDKEETHRAAELATDVFSGLMETEIVGHIFQYNIWDQISCYRGVEKLLMDLAVRPEFMHRTANRFMEIAAATFRQYVELGLLNANPLLLHCTPACSRELPATDHTGTTKPQDAWGRCSAQIFAAVSPQMHDEFDLEYNQQLFGSCGLLYYGCCEPLDTKIDILRNRFTNLRKISITPWADPEIAAQSMGGDFVMSAKPNPAFVAGPSFDPDPVQREIHGILEACVRHGTTCEIVLKDVSTIANQPANLTRWAQTVDGVIDQYF